MSGSKSTRLEFQVIKLLVLAAPLFFICVTALLTQSAASQAPPQSQAVPQWQKDAGAKMAFEVVSVKQNKSSDPPNGNVPMGPGDYYSPTGGFFTATNVPLYGYITFAYKATANQTRNLHDQVPKWVLSDKFDVQARTEGNPTKDQMRLMMQSLLADRFKLVMHTETRQLPVFGLTLEKPGKTGPQLQPHSADAPCPTDPQRASVSGSAADAVADTVAGGFPAVCGGVQPMEASVPGRVRLGGRNVTLALIAATMLVMPNAPDRPVLDKTGLTGTFDFFIEYTPRFDGPPPPGVVTPQPDDAGPTFLEALKDQLGLKLEPQTGPVDVLVMDHIEEPSAN